MTFPRALLAAMPLALALASAAEAPIEFSGVMTTGGKTRVALTDTATKTTTWVDTGAEFAGYTVERVDAANDSVILKRGAQETRLALALPKTTEPVRGGTGSAARPSPATSADATATSIRGNLRLLADLARRVQAERGLTSVSYADLVGPDKTIRELRPIAGENYSGLTFGPGVSTVSVTTASGTNVSLDLPPATPAPAPATAVAATAAPTPTPAAVAAATPVSPLPVVPAPPPAAGATASSNAAAPAEPSLEPTGRQPASPSYLIQGGDTWEKISTQTGVPVSQLRQLNPSILDGSPLPSGQTIRVR